MPTKPFGQLTRGKTAPNRLRKTDTFLAVAYPEFVRHLPGIYVDLGYGAYPFTSVETLGRLRRLNGRLRVLGVEIDPQRVADAQAYAQPGLEFRLGGFNLPLRGNERAAVVRAFNVLRQYTEADVEAALAALETALTPNGLLIEGTCNPDGRLMTFNVFQKMGAAVGAVPASPLRRTTLVFAPSLRADFLPRQLQPVLPKNFIHHAEPGGLIDQFFAAWHKSWQAARAQGRDTRQVFYHSALRLADIYGYDVVRRPALLKRGFLCLGPEWPEKHSAFIPK